MLGAAEAAQGRKRSMMTGALLGAAGVAGAAMLLGSGSPARAEPAPEPHYVEEEVIIQRPRRVEYVPTCQMMRKKIWIDSETYTYKRVEVCE